MASVVPGLFATSWTVVSQAPLSMEFSRQEYWSGLPYPPPGDLPDPGIEPTSLYPRLQAKEAAEAMYPHLTADLGAEESPVTPST